MPKALIDAILGLVQGLTEFLPVSSSGHLVVVPALAGWNQPTLTFDLVLHLGTLIAVVAYFRRDLWAIAMGILGRGEDPVAARRLFKYLVIGSIPAGIAGFAFQSFFEDLFQKPGWVCVFWVGTAGILWGAERLASQVRERAIDTRVALVIGAAQAVSITPGISRSGSTIAAGLGMGLSREEATRFSFLLSIPAITGATLTVVPDVMDGKFDMTGPVIGGFLVSLVSGYIAVAWLIRLVRSHSLIPFSAYLLLAAPAAALALALR